ncbi:probable RNA helicase armi [Danaus plexippus]|uniref:probable RNA helicase armi n=1 Tax=Danaus plexippus TaxID=13037 RepID=UPI002AB12342|nr:probable RNA helicase armi [Danaus plexippus]XP_061385969.1 probable RNA helicase armi [Danaus plexippus]
MLSYLYNFLNYLFYKQDEESDEDKEMFLAEELLQLEFEAENEASMIDHSYPVEPPKLAAGAVCFQKTGIITDCGDDYVLIDGMLYFATQNSLSYNVNDKVLYLGYKDSNDSINVVRILENQGLFWGDENEEDVENFNTIEHILIGQVDYREERMVYIVDSDLKFNLDNVAGTFIPIKGDWLEMKCTVQQNEKRPVDINTKQVLQVKSFNAIRTKTKTAIVTQWSGSEGVCDRQIYINNSALVNGSQINIGTKVMVEAIESNQGSCTWRALKLMTLEIGSEKNVAEESNEGQISLALEKEKKIHMTYPLKFENVKFDQTESIILNITNKSNNMYILNKWIMLSKKRDSQVCITPFINQPIKLSPEENISFTITCSPKFMGYAQECLVVLFRGFQLKRHINIHVCSDHRQVNFDLNGDCHIMESDKADMMRKIRRNTNSYVPGVKPIKSPAFISVKIGNFPIPDKIWAVVLGDSKQTICSNDFNRVLSFIERQLPYLSQDLNITNYIDKWHALLYMEEIQANLNMRVYDRSKVFLVHCDEYLGIEIPGLSEKRPSLIKGDRVIVKDIWNESNPEYEGYIHAINGDMVLMKFNSRFHEYYSGSDVSIEFHFSRAVYRRSHHCINQALSNLGPDILFPSRVITKESQVSNDVLEDMKWFNPTLNKDQRNAVINILKGECRPMPYIIFGPPGTGKTVTVIETILQILTLIPDSRILVATPSNSASNLITERLIKYKDSFSGSVVRLIANYLVDSDTIPEDVKPFCATLDIAKENTTKSKHYVKDNIQLNCQKSLIVRHRVTIGTCYCLGSLKHLDIPRGHYTHIIVDEAGQATEPEIMLPLTFTNKEHGQIILAGDPMQLGPVAMSKYCKEFGLDVSFLCRLLECFPYLKDYESYACGFDKRLVTKLNDNYRSLKEVLTLPSEMFYDGTLVPNVDKSMPWTEKFIDATCQIFGSDDRNGGIFVYGIKGTNMRAQDSPSWYNPQEAAMVALTTCKLFKKNITEEEIGIITPYIAQTKYLRLLFDSMGLNQPKIGTVEDFQGQERPVILISTVRSSESHLEEDAKHYLGFVKSPKRLNVALTRAQVSVILFCNPHLLSKDHLWRKVISYAVSSDKYMGCDLPTSLLNNLSL